MRIINVTPDMTVLPLGRLGENERTQFVFDVNEWLAEYPDANIGLMVRLPHAEDSYPVILSDEGDGKYAWTVTSADLSVEGTGKCQLKAIKNQVIVKSKRYNTRIDDALDGAGDAPAEWESWLDAIQRAAGLAIIKDGKLRFAINDAGHLIMSYTDDVPIDGEGDSSTTEDDVTWIHKDLGPVEAYAQAVAGGYTGTKAEWIAEIANASTNAQLAEDYKEASEQAKDDAQAAAATASAAYNTDLLAPVYTSYTTYKKGDFVIYDGGLYRAKETHSSTAWNADNWENVTFNTVVRAMQEKTDNLLTEVGDEVIYDFIDGKYISTTTTHTVGDTLSLTPSSSPRYVYTVREVTEGDIVTIKKARTYDESSPYIFIDADNKILAIGASGTVTDVTVTAPENTAKLVINSYRTDLGMCYVNKLIKDRVLEKPETAGTQGQVLTSDGNGGQSWEDPTGGDPTEIIDDTAGTGDTDKVWSADKSAAEKSSLLTQINSAQEEVDAMKTATASDVNKALCAKTIVDGEVTEWQFLPGGGDSEDADLRDTLKVPFIYSAEQSKTETNADSVENFSIVQGMTFVSQSDGIRKYSLSNGSEKSPAIDHKNMGAGSHKWLISITYKLTKVNSSAPEPRNMRLFINSSSNEFKYDVVYGEWTTLSEIITTDLTRVYFSVYNFPTAAASGDYTLEIKDYYVYNIDNVSDEMVAYIQEKQKEEFTNGTVQYVIPEKYAVDDTLTQRGKAADAKAVSDLMGGIPTYTEIPFSEEVYIDDDGDPVSSNSIVSTDYIDITGADCIEFSGKLGSSRFCVHWYDESKDYLGESVKSQELQQNSINILPLKPYSAKYVILTSNKLDTHNAVVFYGKSYDRILSADLVGDGVADDTIALQRYINCASKPEFNQYQIFRITSPITIHNASAKSINGNGATIIVDGNFYALSVVGTLASSSNPTSINADVMRHEASTIIRGLRITSSDGESGGGIEITKAFKLIIEDNYIFKCGTGLRVYDKNRDLRISGNNIYAVTGDCILFDQNVDLHQCNIVDNMIQYALCCIKIYKPYAIANFQIVGNDIEISTYPTGYDNASCLWFESASNNTQFSEINISGNTIQGHGVSPNIIHLQGYTDKEISLVSITGNHISNSQNRAIYIKDCIGMAISSNTYANIDHFVYDLNGYCKNIVIVGDTAIYVYEGKLHADEDAVLENVKCKLCYCGPYGNNNIETSNVTNIDID